MLEDLPSNPAEETTGGTPALRGAAATPSQTEDGWTVGEAVRTQAFWVLAGIFAVQGLCHSGLMAHVFSAGVVGPLVMGVAYDVLGTYRPGVAVFVALMVLSLPLLLVLRAPQRRAPA